MSNEIQRKYIVIDKKSDPELFNWIGTIPVHWEELPYELLMLTADYNYLFNLPYCNDFSNSNFEVTVKPTILLNVMPDECEIDEFPLVLEVENNLYAFYNDISGEY